MRVIVGNPAIADVNVDSPKLISIFGKSVGETNFDRLGAADQTPVVAPCHCDRPARPCGGRS